MARKIECKVCRKVPDCPQVKDDVWAQIGQPDDLLCLEHAEEALGRHIVPEDLASCPANSYALELAKRNKQ